MSESPSVKVLIIYPQDKSKKIYTGRFLKENNIDFQKVTMVADVPEQHIDRLKGWGNEVIPLNGSAEPIESETDNTVKDLTIKLINLMIKAGVNSSSFLEGNEDFSEEQVGLIMEIAKENKLIPE